MSCNYGAIASSINGELDNYNNILTEFKSIHENLEGLWHSDAGTKLQGSLSKLNGEIGEEYSELQRFCNTLNDTQTCVNLDEEIATLQEKIDELGDCTENYTEKGITKTRVNSEKLAIKNSYIRYKNQKMDEKAVLKQKISGALGGFGLSASEIENGGNFVTSSSLLAEMLGVSVDYINGLNLPSNYKLGDRLIPSDKVPTDYKYVGPHGYPVLAAGTPTVERTLTEWYERNYGTIEAGKEYNLTFFGTIAANDFNDHKFTWYSVQTQGLHKNASKWYKCDDGFFRDEDGYIVVAQEGFNNNIDDPSQEHIVATPFGLGKVLDVCGMHNYIDLYRWRH